MRPGDRIELIGTPDPYSKLGFGDRGTVRRVVDHPSLGFTQVTVDWDRAQSTLMLTLPDDRRLIRFVDGPPPAA